MSQIIRVATVNILNDQSRWNERMPMLVQAFTSHSFDLIALQEVTNPLGKSTAHQLANELEDYSVHVCPKTGWGQRFEGIAILSRLPVERHWILDLQGQQRTAQFLQVQVGEKSLMFVNGHYYWWPTAHASRVKQVKLVQDWLQTYAPQMPAIVCGDFNATPDSLPISMMRSSFQSTYATRHRKEPDFTCPTPLVSGNQVTAAIKSAALRLFTNRPGESWKGTIDYIFATRDIKVIESERFLDQPAENDLTLYPSDHLGLAATLEVPGWNCGSE